MTIKLKDKLTITGTISTTSNTIGIQPDDGTLKNCAILGSHTWFSSLKFVR